jgi:hypothetical protein
MDGVSAAGGVIAIISLAIQLVDGTRKLHGFVASIKESPAEIQDLALVSFVAV